MFNHLGNISKRFRTKGIRAY